MAEERFFNGMMPSFLEKFLLSLSSGFDAGQKLMDI
jgi:hypothetical protein